MERVQNVTIMVRISSIALQSLFTLSMTYDFHVNFRTPVMDYQGTNEYPEGILIDLSLVSYYFLWISYMTFERRDSVTQRHNTGSLAMTDWTAKVQNKVTRQLLESIT